MSLADQLAVDAALAQPDITDDPPTPILVNLVDDDYLFGNLLGQDLPCLGTPGLHPLGCIDLCQVDIGLLLPYRYADRLAFGQ